MIYNKCKSPFYTANERPLAEDGNPSGLQCSGSFIIKALKWNANLLVDGWVVDPTKAGIH